ncbi:hypothetical protein ACOMHN_050255 [Nucella lapillus]
MDLEQVTQAFTPLLDRGDEATVDSGQVTQAFTPLLDRGDEAPVDSEQATEESHSHPDAFNVTTDVTRTESDDVNANIINDDTKWQDEPSPTGLEITSPTVPPLPMTTSNEPEEAITEEMTSVRDSTTLMTSTINDVTRAVAMTKKSAGAETFTDHSTTHSDTQEITDLSLSADQGEQQTSSISSRITDAASSTTLPAIAVNTTQRSVSTPNETYSSSSSSSSLAGTHKTSSEAGKTSAGETSTLIKQTVAVKSTTSVSSSSSSSSSLMTMMTSTEKPTTSVSEKLTASTEPGVTTSTTARSTTDCLAAIKVDDLNSLRKGQTNMTLTWEPMSSMSRVRAVYRVKVKGREGDDTCFVYTVGNGTVSEPLDSDDGQLGIRQTCKTMSKRLTPVGGTIVIRDLQPCTTYDVTVTSECGTCPCNVADTSASKSFETLAAVPGRVEEIHQELNDSDTSRVRVTWTVPASADTCRVQRYLLKVFMGSTCVTQVNLLGKDDERRDGGNVVVVEEEEEFIVMHVTSDSVTLTWMPPEPRPGPMQYFIQLLDMGSPYNPHPRLLHNSSRHCVTGYDKSNCTVDELWPYWTYNFTLTAHTAKGDSVPAVLADLVTTQAAGSEAVSSLSAQDVGATNVTLQWSRPLVTNGHLTGYGVKVMGQVPTAPTHISLWAINATTLNIGWQSPEPRPGATNYSIVLNRATELNNHSLTFTSATSMTLMGWSQRGAVVTHLWSGWRYSLTLTAFTSKGSSRPVQRGPVQMPQSQPDKVENMSVSAVANDYRHVMVTWDYPPLRDRHGVIVNFTSCCRRQGSKRNHCQTVQQPFQPTSPQFCATFNVIPGRNYTLKEIRDITPRRSKAAANLEENKMKNRYTNILPYDHSRVKLVQLNDDVTTDYINANYIPGYHSKGEYIASQGPLERIVDDFWRMVWEQCCPVIVMLSALTEGRLNKVYKYFPDEDQLNEPVCYGMVTVTLLEVHPHEDYLVRTFRLSVGRDQREVKQFFVDSWKDFKANLTPSMVLEFVRAVREEVPPDNKHPLLVHCSAGVGRTGTWIAIDYFMHYIRNSLPTAPINIQDFVVTMRQNRVHMVQSLEQYVFLHEVVADLVRRKTEVDRYDEPAYRNEPVYANLAYDHESDVNPPSSSFSSDRKNSGSNNNSNEDDDDDNSENSDNRNSRNSSNSSSSSDKRAAPPSQSMSTRVKGTPTRPPRSRSSVISAVTSRM